MLVAYSGGVDSTVLAVVARQVLGDRMLAVLAESETYPAAEVLAARSLASELGLPLVEIHTDELDDPEFARNSPDRCYQCKQELFGRLLALAQERGLEVVADGTNADDLSDYRPGRRAAAELGRRRSHRRSGVDQGRRARGGSAARASECREAVDGVPRLAVPVRRARGARGAGARGCGRGRTARPGAEQVRVRAHGPVARVEVAPDELEHAWAAPRGDRAEVKAAGFAYATLDLEGYRTGALNEVLADELPDELP